MTDLRKAAEMALDALLTCDVDYDYDENPYNTFDAEDVSEAIDALRQALNVDAIDISATCVDETEKREHEPVAWYYVDSDVEIHSVALSEDLDDDQKANCIPLYTAPLSKQEPVWCGCGDGIVANDEAMCGVCVMRLKDQIERLKAQPEQEPVAWLVSDAQGRYATIRDPSQYGEEVYEPLYAAPPKREWVGLTDDEIKEGAKYSWVDYQAFQSVAWWADEKLKEKNT